MLNIKFLDYAKVSFEDWHSPDTRKPFIDILYYKNKKEFIKTLKELLITGFNPDELFARIDELAKFIAPHVERDSTPDESGFTPGHINRKTKSLEYTMETFWNSIGSGNYEAIVGGTLFGLKKYIQTKFDAVCKIYGINKTEILLKAKIYRSKRALEVRIYDIKQEIIELKEKLRGLSDKKKEEIQKQINQLKNTIKSLNSTIKTLKY